MRFSCGVHFHCELGASWVPLPNHTPPPSHPRVIFLHASAPHSQSITVKSFVAPLGVAWQTRASQAFTHSTGSLRPSFPPGSKLLVQKFSAGTWMFLGLPRSSSGMDEWTIVLLLNLASLANSQSRSCPSFLPLTIDPRRAAPPETAAPSGFGLRSRTTHKLGAARV